MARPTFSARHVLGCDAVVHGWLYRDRQQRTHVAVFDASHLHGVDLRALDALQRHKAVHGAMHQVAHAAVIQYHWCGHEEHCMRPFHTFKLDFDVSCIARLTHDLLAPGTSTLRVMWCLLVGDADLAPPRIIVPPGIRLVHVVLLVPAGPSAAVVAPEWVCMSRGAKCCFCPW